MQATPLLLVPGLMCDATVWAPLRPVLDAVARCQVVDHATADSLTQMAQQLLDAAPPTFALAGHSMGGRVALEVVRLAPQRVRGLALLDTGHLARPGGAAGEEEARKRHALLEVARREGVAAMARQWVQGMVHPARRDDRALVDGIVAMFARKTADIFEGQIRALLNRPDATPVLQGLQTPVLVLCGRQDSWAPPVQHEALAALIPGQPPVQVIDDAGHMSTLEQPQAVAQALRTWLDRVAD